VRCVDIRNRGVRLDAFGDARYQIAKIRQLRSADRAAPVYQLQRDAKAAKQRRALADHALPPAGSELPGQCLPAYLQRFSKVEFALPQTVKHGRQAGFVQAQLDDEISASVQQRAGLVKRGGGSIGGRNRLVYRPFDGISECRFTAWPVPAS